MSFNPVHEALEPPGKDPFDEQYDGGWRGPGWYFWDETWAYRYGPYDTSEEAEAALREYLEHL